MGHICHAVTVRVNKLKFLQCFRRAKLWQQVLILGDCPRDPFSSYDMQKARPFQCLSYAWVFFFISHMDHGSQKKACGPHGNHTVKATGGSVYDTAGPWSSQQTSWTGDIFRKSCRNLHCPRFSDCFLCLVGGLNNSMDGEEPAITERHLEGAQESRFSAPLQACICFS